MKFLLTTTYKDGMVSRFEFETDELISEVIERIANAKQHKNVESWHIEVIDNG